MTLRLIKPLNERDWNILIADLEKGQTEEQRKILERALKHVATLKISQ